MAAADTSILLYEHDVPQGFDLPGTLAIDTETMGLVHGRDRLCLVQVSNGDGRAHLIKIGNGQQQAPRLQALIENAQGPALMHFARFDLAVLKAGLGIEVPQVFCTKIASKLTRTYTDHHGLKDLCAELLDVDLSKQQQTSNWAAVPLSAAQQAYAANDVLYLHALADQLRDRLQREGRLALAQAHFDFLPTRAAMDLTGWADRNLFDHGG